MQWNDQELINRSWTEAWRDPHFRRRLQWGMVLLIPLLISFPFFFNFIESREGSRLNDPFIQWLPAYDLSSPTFMIIWATVGFYIYRGVHYPNMLLMFLWGFIVLSLTRILTIYFIPLHPPDQLIPFADPITNFFYGKQHAFITKDLFYSGHTSTMFLCFLCFIQRRDKIIALVSTLLVGIMVLIQHVHYSVDVLAAMPFTYIVYRIAGWIVGR